MIKCNRKRYSKNDTLTVVSGSNDLASKLTNNQRIFCDEYLIDRNGSRAYRAAYKGVKSDRAAESSASRLLRNVKVRNYIDARFKVLSDKAGITAKRVLEEEARIAFSDIRQLYDGNTLIAPSNLTEDVARAISSIRIKKRNITDSDGIEYVETTYDCRFWDKGAALGRLEKYFGMYKEKVDFNMGIEFICER